MLDEIQRGDPEFAAQRMERVAALDILTFSDEVESLIREFNQKLGLGGAAIVDLPHFAFAVAYRMDYLVTWNCKHIANGQVIRRLTKLNAAVNRATPVIVTPEELLTSLPGDDES